ncbi:caspase family protein [Cupriavidus oxalaticus]|uniref:Caspase family protein n=2 Tax=Cupriavidus oxalaticus TaxID=96344 RepID=A0A5P3VEU3_9BURK|nr:caspase family protein [Cupriavidus oxalaticus]
MRMTSLHRTFVLVGALLLGGCAANQLPGFQNAYKGYNVPEPLVATVRHELKRNGLPNAQVTRDNAGRIRLVGSYQNEDEVDRAFFVVQSIVGIKSTSPFYPENVKEKRWDIHAGQALTAHARAVRNRPAPAAKRALIIGINTFRDKRITAILGEDDARRVKMEAEKASYRTTALLGQQATKANIEAALKRFRDEVGPNDTVLIYVSSHGTMPVPSPRLRDARKMSIIAYDSGNPMASDRDFPMSVFETSVSDIKLQEVAQMPSRQTRLIIDTCYSGEILKGIPDDSRRYVLEANGGVPERAGISMAAWTGEAYEAKGIRFAEAASRGTQAQQQDARGTQIPPGDINRYTIITATSDGEESWGPAAGGSFDSPVSPGKRLQGSFFTQAFFEYLAESNGHIEPAFNKARQFTVQKVAGIPAAPNYKGPLPIRQVPRLNPPLPAGDPSSIYE